MHRAVQDVMSLCMLQEALRQYSQCSTDAAFHYEWTLDAQEHCQMAEAWWASAMYHAGALACMPTATYLSSFMAGVTEVRVALEVSLQGPQDQGLLEVQESGRCR